MKEVKHKNSGIVCTATTKLLGDYWVLSILAVLAHESLRFCELQRRLQMVNPVTLTNRLQQLEESKLVERKTGLVDEISVTYSLTALGEEALVVVDALNTFAKKAEKATHS